nr:glycine-rich cell wall structural protein 1-like [Aegilops tauschii subsp. strangulata]
MAGAAGTASSACGGCGEQVWGTHSALGEAGRGFGRDGQASTCRAARRGQHGPAGAANGSGRGPMGGHAVGLQQGGTRRSQRARAGWIRRREGRACGGGESRGGAQLAVADGAGSGVGCAVRVTGSSACTGEEERGRCSAHGGGHRVRGQWGAGRSTGTTAMGRQSGEGAPTNDEV